MCHVDTGNGGKEAEKVWKELKEDKTSTEEERIEGMKKINHIVGSNLV